MRGQLEFDDVVAVTVAAGSENETIHLATISPWCGKTEDDGPGLYWYDDGDRLVWHCGLQPQNHRGKSERWHP